MVSIDQQRRSTFFFIIYIYIYILDLHHQEFKGDVDIVLFAYFDDVFECIASPIIVESVLVGWPFSLEVLLGFVSYFDYVPTFFNIWIWVFFFLVLVWLSWWLFSCMPYSSHLIGHWDSSIRGDPQGTFRPNWDGLHVIRELTLEVPTWLTYLDRNRFLDPIDVD